jgi:hypothetical protein
MLMRCKQAFTNILANPAERDQCRIHTDDSQLLYGESFEIIDETRIDGYVFGRSVPDGYEGHVLKSDLLPAGKDYHPNYIIRRAANVHRQPDIMTVPVMTLPGLARIQKLGAAQNGFVEIDDLGWIKEDLVTTLKAMNTHTTYPGAAKSFLGTPYLFAGRTDDGMDCSALVIAAHIAVTGKKLPHSCGQQIMIFNDAANGWITPLNFEKDRLKPGDILYFKRPLKDSFERHAAIVTKRGASVINANPDTGSVVEEALRDLIRQWGKPTEAFRPIRQPG